MFKKNYKAKLKMQNKQAGLYAKFLTGHRMEYLQFIQEIIPSKQLQFKEIFFKKEPVIFLMIEDSPLTYFFISIFRSLFKLQTVGFLFRPSPIFKNNNLQMKIKYFLLRILKLISKVQTLLIVPDTLNHKFKKICDGWIYDMQLWDISKDNFQEFKDLKLGERQLNIFDEIKLQAGNRKVVCAIGSQNKRKGFDVFAEAYVRDSEIRSNYLFVFGGSLEGYSTLLEQFKQSGGMAINRYVNDEELIALYASSDIIWALYDSGYDQASGIFGRALQFGVPSIVRYQSLVDKLCDIERISVLSLFPEEINLKSLDRVIYLDEINGINYQKKFKEISIVNLRNAIKLDV
tara:strand:+ start:6238 stop:7275 length:1038 start_codon:yes stop_codon:yes gene_type:complete